MKSIKTLGIVIVMISMITIIFTGCGEEKKAAVAAYNSECSRIEAEQATLEKSISDSQALIDSKEKPYDNSTIPALETAITDAKVSIVEIPKKEGNAEKINALVNDKLKKISQLLLEFHDRAFLLPEIFLQYRPRQCAFSFHR